MMVVNRLVHVCWNRLFMNGLNNVVGTIMINQWPCSCMIGHVVREWWNNKIERWCYNNHELGCWTASSRVLDVLATPVNSTSCTQDVETWLNNTVILKILFYHVNSAVGLSKGCWANNTVIACDIFTCIPNFYGVSCWCDIKNILTNFNKCKSLYTNILKYWFKFLF